MNPTANPSPTAQGPTRRFDQITLLLTSLVLLVPVVSFVADISPLDTVRGFLGKHLASHVTIDPSDAAFVDLGAPMLTGWMLLAARWRLHVAARIGGFFQVCAWLAAGASISTTTWVIIGQGKMQSLPDQLTGLLPLLTVLAGLSLLAWRWLRHGADDRNPVIALEVAFAAHALFLVSGFFGDGQIGWWLTLACLLGILPDLISAWARPSHPSASPARATIVQPSTP